MKYTIDEQYKIQYKETKEYWKKRRRKRALIYFILSISGAIALLLLRNSSYYILIQIPLTFGIIAGLTCTLRELIIPMKEETRDLNQLTKIYDEERFKERNG